MASLISAADKKAIIDYYVEKAKNDTSEILHYVLDEIKNDLDNMYNSFIEDFYSYPTDMYIRHGEVDAGTGVGHNLYNGNRIRKRNKFIPSLTIDFSSENMQGGYKFDSASYVLDQVMNGIRFPATKKQKGKWKFSHWESRYYSPVAKMTFMGTMQSAFETYDAMLGDIVESMFFPLWHKKGWK